MRQAKPRRLLAGRVALVTGASSGIGWAMALGFAEAGADLILVARRSHRLAQLAQAIQAMGRKALLVVADVAEKRAVKRIVHQAGLEFSRLDVLVNNAGILLPERPAHETPVDDWDRVLAVNLRGPFLLSRLVIPQMLEAGYGRIINLTSGWKAERNNGAYSASKAALWALTKVMAQELKGTGVLVNALDPGWIRSEMSPEGGGPPERVVPLALRLASLPSRGPTGREFRVPWQERDHGRD